MKQLFITRKMWVLILTLVLFGANANATQIPIPSVADSLEHFLENHTDLYANGDTILLVDESYVINGTPDLYHGVTIMGDPALATPPLISFPDDGFRLKQDSTSVYIKGLRLDGSDLANGKTASFILRMNNIPASDSIFGVMKIEDVEAWGFGGAIDLHQQKHAQYDSVIVTNCIMHDFSGEYVVDPNINFPGVVLINNSTFYNITHGFVKNPDFASDKNNYTKIPKTYIIDHNTIYNIGGKNNALIQVNDPKDSTVTLTFTNNIVQKLYDPTNVRPFRIDPSAGTFDFDYNVIYDFMPTNPDKDQYSLDSTAANQTNVTVTNAIAGDPELLDVGNFMLPLNSPLLTADSDGGQVGDPRWGEFEGVYVYEPEDKVFTNTDVQIDAAIILGSGNTDLTWDVDIFYGETRGTATIDAAGLLSTTVAGQVKVTATSVENGAFYDTLIVTIQDSIHVTGMQVHADPMVITEEDGDIDVIASLTPSNPTDPRVEWSVSDDRIAEINGVSNDTVIELVGKINGVVEVIATSLDNPAIADTIEITVAIPGIVAHWKFDETAGDVAADEKIFSDGVLRHGSDALWVAGLDGNALNLASGDDSTCVVIPSNDLNDFDSTTSFSMSILFNVPDFTGNNELMFKGYTGTDPAVPGSKGNWIAMNLSSKTLRFFIDDNTTKTNLDFSPANMYLHAGGWNHVVCTRDLVKDSLFIYLNGIQVASMLDGTELDISSGPLPWVIGGGGKLNAPFAGMVDDAILYNIALSPEEVAAKTAEYGIVAPPLSSDATLSDLTVAGTTVAGFSADTEDYAVELDAGTTDVPLVFATTTNEFAKAIVTAAASLPGTTTINVTAADGTTKAYSIAFTVKPDALDQLLSSGIKVLPNPANDFITLNINQKSEVIIHSIAGEVLINEVVEAGASIDIQDLASGMYFATIKIGDKVGTLQFVKE